jgi:hypothetical protein
MNQPVLPTREARRAQMFPALTSAEIARMARFGTPRHFLAPNQPFKIPNEDAIARRSGCSPSVGHE